MPNTQTVSFDSTLEINGEEIDVSVEAEVFAGAAATYWQPEDPGEIDIVSVKGPDGKEIELTPAQEGSLQEQAFFAVEDSYPEYG